MRFIGILLLFILLFGISAQGLGIGPAKNTIPYTGQQTVDGQFYVFKQIPDSLRIGFSVQGELAPFLQLYETETVLREESVRIPFRLDLPSGLAPGVHEAKIYVQEMRESAGMTNAQIRLPHKVIVSVPYPDTHVTADVVFDKRNKPLRIVTQVTNTGSVPILDIGSEHTLYDHGKKVSTLLSETASLSPGEAKQLSSFIVPNLSPGTYSASTRVFYDKEIQFIQKDFSFGEPSLVVDAFSERVFTNQVNKISFVVSNEWNEDLEEVTATILITDPEGAGQDILTSESFTVNGRRSQTVYTYWDTTDRLPGKYPVSLVLYSKDRSFDSSFTLDLQEQRLKVSDMTIRLLGLVILVLLAFLAYGVLSHNKRFRRKSWK